MTTGACVIGWRAGIPGREARGLETFGKAVQRFEDLAKTGRIHAHKEYFATTGRTGGFMLIEGDLAELHALMEEPEQRKLIVEGAQIVQDFSVKYYAGGTDKAVQERMADYAEVLQGLGVM
ncbi:MAG TPA: hypothetical protein VGB83_08950 [Actinomycetota bacterium]